MMNIIALCLVAISLATASVWSPNPTAQDNNKIKTHNHHEEDEVLATKDGLRVIVVEYEKGGGGATGGKTKVLISPQEPHDGEDNEKISTLNNDDEEKTKDGASSKTSHYPRELICDAFGKCKHVIAGAFSKAKDKAKEKAHEVEETVEAAREAVSRKAHGVEEGAKETVEAAGEAVFRKAHGIEEGVKEAVDGAGHTVGKGKDTVSEKSHKIHDAVGGAVGKGKDAVSNKTRRIEKRAKEAVGAVGDVLGKGFEKGKEAIGESAKVKCDIAKDTLKNAKDIGKTIKGDVSKNVSEDLDIVRKQVDCMAKEGIETAEVAAEKVVPTNVVTSVVMWAEAMVGSLLGVIHMMGFALAYGMSVWITFVSSYVLAGALPRQQFGMVQSKIYPLYFRAMTYSIGIALLGHVLSQREKMYDVVNYKAEMFQGVNLVASLLMLSVNLLYLEPRATKVMFERMKLEKEEGRGTDGIEPQSTTNGAGAAGTTTSSTTTTPCSATQATTTTKTTTTRDQQQCEGGTATMTRIAGLNERLKKLNSNSSLLNILTLMSLTWHLVYLGQRLHMSSHSC